MYKELFQRDPQHNCARGLSRDPLYLRWCVSTERGEKSLLSFWSCEFLFSFQSMVPLENKLGAIYNVW